MIPQNKAFYINLGALMLGYYLGYVFLGKGN